MPGLTARQIPTDPTTAMFRLVADILKADDTLGNVVQTWRTWTGDRNDAEPPQLTEMPWVRITPIESPMTGETESDYNLPFRILIEFATGGTNVDDQLNLWGAIRRALNFDKPYLTTQVGLAIRPAGGAMGLVSTPRFGPYRPAPTEPNSPSSPPEAMVGKTIFTVLMDIPSLTP